MTELMLGGALLLLTAVGLLVFAFRWQSAGLGASVNQAQRAFYRQRLEELEQERASQWIDGEQFHALELDLERQLLSESSDNNGTQQRGRPLRTPLIGFLIVATIVAAPLLYRQLGAFYELALYQKERELSAKEQWTKDDIEALKTLTTRSLGRRPDNPELLWLQARLDMELGDYPAAAASYQTLVEQLPDSASALAQWAQALYLSSDRQIDPQVRALLDRALVLDPQQTTALGLLGIDAFSRGDYLPAVDYWQRLQRLLPPGSGQLAAISEGLQRAKLAAHDAGQLRGLVVEVDVSEALAGRAEGWLYVFAKADDGMPLPVAVARMPVMGSWPRRVLLSDADAMTPSRLISQFETISLTARISRSGNAMASSGDLQGFLPAISVASDERIKRIVIDSVQP